MSKKILSLFLLLINLGLFINMANGQGLPERSDIDNKYKWNLKDIYENDEAWENDFTWVENQISEIQKFQGKLINSSNNLLEYLEFSNQINKKFNKVYFYAFSSRDLNLNNGTYQSMADKVTLLASKLSAANSFAVPEIMKIDDRQLKEYLVENEELMKYKHYLIDLLRMRNHTLPAEQEKMLAMMSPVFSSISQTYGVLNDAELPFPEIESPDGEEIKLSHGRYRSGLYSQNREYRKSIYKGTYEPYNALKGTFAGLFNGRVKTRITKSQLRNYPNALSMALHQNNIPVNVYDNLINTAKENINALHRWAEIKKRVLKLDELHPYDTYVSLFPAVSREYTFDQAKEIALEALAPLGEEYINAVKKAFDNRWIDVYETKGKRSGAYSNSCACGTHPLILLNWNNTLDDLFVLVHELGHNMHSYFTEKHQPFHYADYSIFVAEIASITNESLLLEYLIENAESKDEKLALIEKFLVNAQATFFRQTRFAEFEKIVHERAESGNFLNADKLTELFAELYSNYWGEAMTTDYEEGLSWARVHHFVHYNFYVYQYATGFAAAQALSEQILNEGEPAVKRYLENFIYAGNSDFPINTIKKAGVDMSSPEPIVATCNKINKYLDELERLLNE